MATNYTDTLSAVFLIIIVFGIFGLATGLRIKNAWELLRKRDVPLWKRVKSKLDIIFSGILFIALVLIFVVVVLNFGR